VPPEGGETEYADLRAAWDALPPIASAGSTSWWPSTASSTRGTIGYDQFTERGARGGPPVPQAVVRTHPATGRKALYVGSTPRTSSPPLEESRALLVELLEFATHRHFVYSHVWRQHDLVMWTTAACSTADARGTSALPPRHAPDHGRGTGPPP